MTYITWISKKMFIYIRCEWWKDRRYDIYAYTYIYRHVHVIYIGVYIHIHTYRHIWHERGNELMGWTVK
jgi:hypothetical protein